VATDALETLGTFPIPDNSGRDAIHLAVEPVIAGEMLGAGARIKITDGKAYAEYTDAAIGIVDPFVAGPVRPGDRFWLVVLPRTITSLRHVWSHPLFPEEPASSYHADADEHYVADDPKSSSERWIADFAAKIDQTVPRLMRAAEDWLESREGGGWGDYTYDNTEAYKDHWDKFPEFWKHYEIVKGVEVPEKDKESFFTCSC
jgi:hypothetical protein